jgi:predicted TIM-barrel fold metal-dependent hydrolase
MIIDADCHLSSHKWDGLAILASELVDLLDRAGVDRALIWLKPPYDKNIEPENRAVYDANKAFPGRFIPFGWTNPRLGRERAGAAIRQCLEEYGFYGIKFNGAQDDYVIDDDRLALPLIEQAAKYGKPIAFHIGADFYENTHPYRLRRIAQLFPENRFIMIHMGGAGLPPLERAAIEVLQACPNVIAIGSAINEMSILRALQQAGPERVCFGSDTPFGLMHVRLAMVKALMRDFSPADQAKVLGENIARFVGISILRNA